MTHYQSTYLKLWSQRYERLMYSGTDNEESCAAHAHTFALNGARALRQLSEVRRSEKDYDRLVPLEL